MSHVRPRDPAAPGRALAFVALSALFLALSGPELGGAAEEAGARATVDQLHSGMLEVMRVAGELDYQQRFDRLAPVLDRPYDFGFMARKSLGRAFDELPPESQKRWLTLFRDFTVANYAGRFGPYNGQSFETLGEEPGAQETVSVRTRLVDPGSETVDLNYRLRREGSGWRVVDIYLKGSVSELALRRSDFTATLDRSGYESLVQSLQAKIADLAAGRLK